jgi:hypothetical protein
MPEPIPLPPERSLTAVHMRAIPVEVSSRLACAALAGVILLVLGLASWLEPSAAGHGTHRQLGLPACSWAAWFGKPCLTCGMTTSFAYAADLDFARAFRAQPAGALLCVFSACAFWVAGYVALTGSRIGSIITRRIGTRTMTVAGLILGAAWVYKIMTWTK